MNRNIALLKSVLLYGRMLNVRDSVLIGILFGLIGYLLFNSGLFAEVLPEIPFVLILLLIIPMLFIFYVKPVIFDICFPRRNDLSFVMGISYGCRVESFVIEVKNICKFICVTVIASNSINLILILTLRFFMFEAIMLGFVFLPIIEVLLLSYCTILLVKSGFLSATKKDGASLRDNNTVSPFGAILIRFTWKLTSIIVTPLRGNNRLIAMRQLIDVYRYDTVNSLIIPLIAIVFVVVLYLTCHDLSIEFAQLVFIIGAYGVVLATVSGLIESANAFRRLSVYCFSVREVFFGNCYLFIVLTIAFPIAYLLLSLFRINVFVNAMRILQFLCVYFYLIVIAGCWHTLSAIPQRGAFSKTLMYTYLLISLPGLFIPVVGLIFPIVFCLLILLSEKVIFSSDVFHHK